MVKRNGKIFLNNKKRTSFARRSFDRDISQETHAAAFIAKLGLEKPKNELLYAALTHPSYTFENPASGRENNQRLEFLGDAVLDFVIGEYLYLKYKGKSEGELTKMRAAVVNESTLARQARKIGIGQALFLGKGEQYSGGCDRPSILADALEAVFGAVYLQYGFEEVRRFILKMLVPEIAAIDKNNYGDFKTILQERAQKEDMEISYRIIKEQGPDHDKLFTAGVYVQGACYGKGTGKTKKEAEQQAARLALDLWEGKKS